ncbi:MAG TPA: HIT domain-containing protein [Beijerinckiaceae bacterium]|nr:HIT domain-containing protein [Beijerinckiaceae bacterium]
MSDFRLDPRLERDTLVLGDLALCRVLMMNDARYPWLILVPRRPDLTELIDLIPADQESLFREIVEVSAALRAVHNPDKLNIGALGNIVRQLHVHIVGRFASDPAWPGPVWGHSPAHPYPAHMAGIARDRLIAALDPYGLRDGTT